MDRHDKESKMKNVLAVAVFFFSASSQALSLNAERLVYYETKGNAVSTRSNSPIQIEHFEIPEKVVKSMVSPEADLKALEALTFQKNGQRYVRWIINPEDTKWHHEVRAFLEKNGLDSKTYKYFRGYQSASRSYMIEDPKTGHEFFAKVSTNLTGGNWRDKKQEWSDAADVWRAAAHIQDAIKKYQPRHFKYMDESLVLGLEAIDQGMVVRSLKDLSKSKFIYLPGFSAVHEDIGREIALKNGSADPEQFWNENYNKPLARALAEFAIMTGLSYDSPHSQNFLVELDTELRPTGKIILRDTGDVYVSSKYVNAMGSDLAANWPKENVRPDVSAMVGILHGNTKPSWISEAAYEKWGKDYFAEYDKTFSRLTGISETALNAQARASGSTIDLARKVGRNGNYMGKSLQIEGAEWSSFLGQLSAKKGFRVPARSLCVDVLL